MIDFKKLVKAGVHFGHQASRWMPKMDPYIWGVRNKVHLIDVSKTAHQLEKAAQFLQEVAAEGKQILWVGTKKPARAIIKNIATKLDMPYVDYRWVGGTLSNFSQVKKSVTVLLHYEDVLEKSEKYPHYTKKELNAIRKKVDRLQSIVGGIKKLTWPIGAIVIVDVNKEQSALKEAVKMSVPVVAMVDTNSDPSLVDYVIPANDDAPRSIQVIAEYLEEAVEKGLKNKGVAKAKAAASAASQADKDATDIAIELAETESDDEDKVEEKTTTKKEAATKKVKSIAKAARTETSKETKTAKPKKAVKKAEPTAAAKK